MIQKDASVMEWLAVFVGVTLMGMLAFTTGAPYVCAWSAPKCVIPADLVRQIDQTQNTIQNLSLILFGFLFGASVGTRMKDNAIAVQAQTIKSAQDALPPVPGAVDATVTIPAGGTATVTAEDIP